MAGAQKVFEVITEFRFEVGGAVASSRQLQGEVQKISSFADRALDRMGALGTSMLSVAGVRFGGPIAGMVGIANTAVNASEKFRNAQLSFANVISANLDRFSGDMDTFNKRAQVGAQVVSEIAETSRKFGIPEGPLLGMSKTLSAMLSAKGLSGQNFDVPIDISRNLLKAAPNLGVEPNRVGGQLLRMIEGQASGNDTLFRRLSGETDAMRMFVGQTEKFNKLNPAERVKKLREALGEFTADTEVLDARLNSLSGQMNRFNSLVQGVDSIFRPLGEAVKKPLINILKQVNDVLQENGRSIVQNFSSAVSGIIRDPENLYTNLRQLSMLKRDLDKTQSIFATAGVAQFTAFAARDAGKGGITGAAGTGMQKLLTRIPLVGGLLGGFWKTLGRFAPVIGPLVVGFGVLSDAMERSHNPVLKLSSLFIDFAMAAAAVVGALGVFFKVGKWFGLIVANARFLPFLLGAIATALKVIVLPLIGLLTAVQIVSRAIAKAEVADAKAMPSLMERFSAGLTKLKRGFSILIHPFAVFIDKAAELIMPMFRLSNHIDPIVGAFETLSTILASIGNFVLRQAAVVTGVADMMAVLSGRIANMGAGGFAKAMVTGNAGSVFAGLGGTFKRGFDEFLAQNKFSPGQDGGNPTVQNNTNIAKVEVRQDFKENMQPDRIAHSLVKTLGEIGKNPTQAKGKSMKAGLSGAN